VPIGVDGQVDTRGMIKNTFTVEDHVAHVEEKVHEEVAKAFMAADSVYKACSNGSMLIASECNEVGDNEANFIVDENGTWRTKTLTPVIYRKQYKNCMVLPSAQNWPPPSCS